MAKSTLEHSIEQVLDEREGDTVQVIVQARMTDAAVREVATQAAIGMRERMYANSAKDVLPPSKAGLDQLRDMSDVQAEAFVREHRGSLLAQASRTRPVADAKEAIARHGMAATDALLSRTAIAKAAPELESGRRRMARLWLADSVVADLSADQINAMRSDGDVVAGVYANVRFKSPDYARIQRLPATVADNKTSAYGIEASGALAVWGAYGSRGAGVKVAVLDTGIDPTHPDLAGKLAGFAEFDVQGNEIPGAQARDAGEHGTHVAGTIVGGDASGSYIGMAPDAQVLGGLVLPDGGGSVAQIIGGMQWAVAQGADVMNLSLGGLTTEVEVPSSFTNAIVNAIVSGVPVIVAIGNDGSQTTGDPGNDLFAFAVGATDSTDQVAGFSGGRTHVLTRSDVIPPDSLPIPYMKPDISAPGVAVLSSIPGNDYAAFNGTSMATPHVAGAVALLLANTSIRSDVTGADRAFLIQDLLTASVEELGENGQDQRFGFGRLNVLRAVGMAREQGHTVPPVA